MRFCRLAVERAPKSADGYFWLSLCLAATGHPDESAATARRGLELEPHSANMQTALGWSFLLRRRFEEGERELARAESLDPSASFAAWSHGYALQQLGQYDEALTACDKAIAVTGGRHSFYAALRGGVLAQAGRRGEPRLSSPISTGAAAVANTCLSSTAPSSSRRSANATPL